MSPLIGLVLWLGSQLVGSEFNYTVQPKDSLVSIAARFGVDSRVIVERNGLKQLKLQPGQVLTIDNRHIVPDFDGKEIVVNIPQRMLFYFKNARLTEHYPVAAGKRGWTTPIGAFEIVSTDEDPTWHVPPSIQEEMRREGKPILTVVAPGPNNPLGSYRLTTSLPGIAIHGTNVPTSIYSLQTHGCIRLHPDDIQDLFDMTAEGTSGRTIYNPVLIAHIGNSIFIEVHPDVYNKGPDPELFIRETLGTNALADSVDWGAVKQVIRKRDGVARDVTMRASTN
jgi:L,D-transpeptidase ErfK/SrfK